MLWNSITDGRHIRPDRHCSIVRQCDVHCCTLHTYIFFSFSSSPLFLLCHRREKALEGKSKVSHSVHSPYFTDDKQEFWWCYISDRKNHALVTPPIHVTGLVEREEVELKFTAPAKPGMYFALFFFVSFMQHRRKV